MSEFEHYPDPFAEVTADSSMAIAETDPVFKQQPDGERIESVADLLSPSSIEQWSCCQAQYMFRKIENLVERPGAAITYGKGVDAALNVAYSEKFRDPNKATPPADFVTDVFTHEWDEMVGVGDVEFLHNQDPATMRGNGQQLVGTWRDKVVVNTVPSRDPLPFEDRETGKRGQEGVTYDAGDFKIHGYVDLIAEHRMGGSSEIVIDNKTSGRKYKQEDYPAKSSQAQFYTLATGIKHFAFHVGVKTKEPYVQHVPVEVSDSDHELFLHRAATTRQQILNAIATGDFLPNRSHTLCSKRWCGYWRECTKTFGGHVAD